MCEKMCENYDENKVTIEEAYERLLLIMPLVEIQANVIGKIGLNDRLEPIEMGFTGRVKKLGWAQLAHYCGLSILGESFQTYVAKLVPAEMLQPFFTEVTGDELKRGFQTDRPGSCMGKDHCQPWLDIFADNPNDVSLMIGKGCGLFADSLSWLVWQGRNGVRYHDKAYHRTSLEVLHKLRADIAGPENVVDYYGIFGDPMSSAPKAFRLKWNGNRLPYVDTYRFCKSYDTDGNSMTLSRLPQDNEHGSLTEHELGFHPTEEPEPEYTCEDCGCSLCEDDVITLDNGDTYCTGCVQYCEATEEHYPEAVVSYVRIFSDLFASRHRSNITTCHISDEYLHDNCQESTEERGLWIQNGFVVETIDGEITHVDDEGLTRLYNGDYCIGHDVVMCADDEYYLRDECVEIDEVWHPDGDCIKIDGEWRLKENVSEVAQ